MGGELNSYFLPFPCIYTLLWGEFFQVITHGSVAFLDSCICKDTNFQTAPTASSLSSSAELILLVMLRPHTSDVAFPGTTPIYLTYVDTSNDFVLFCRMAVEDREIPLYD